MVFVPQTKYEMPRSKPKNRSQAKILSKEVVVEEEMHAETMREEPPLRIHDSPFHNKEEVPP